MSRNRLCAGITVLLVWLFLAFGSGAHAARGADSPPAKPEPKTILILGDSLAAGFGLDPSEAFPALLQKKVDAAGLNFTVINAGVSGDTTASGLRRMDWQLKRRVDVLVLELGANDGLRGISVAHTKSNLQAIINRTIEKNPRAKIVIAGMQMPPNMGEDYNRRFQKVFPELAKENQALLVPFLLEGVGGKAELNQPDQIHPSVEGHKILAENVWKILQPLLKRMEEGSHGQSRLEATPDGRENQSPAPPLAGLDSTNTPLREVAPGIFEISQVRIDKQRRAVTFPAVLNMDQGPIEYFLVTSHGKVHESVLRTETQPFHIHLAMLLLDAQGAGTNTRLAPSISSVPDPKTSTEAGGTPISSPSKEVLPGDKITIEVNWNVDGKETRRPAEELVFNAETHALMPKGRWVYNGSRVLNGIFSAQLNGSVVSLITDPDALVNNTGQGHENDKIWTVNTNRLPPWNSPVQVTFKLSQAKK